MSGERRCRSISQAALSRIPFLPATETLSFLETLLPLFGSEVSEVVNVPHIWIMERGSFEGRVEDCRGSGGVLLGNG